MQSLPPFEPFRYMRYAKRLEVASGFFLAGSAAPAPSDEEAGFTRDDYSQYTLCHNYGEPRAIELLRQRFNVDPRGIIITAGSSEGNALACMAIVQPGDEVLAETPGYEAFRRLPAAFHATYVPLPRREENGFLPDLKEFKKLLGPRTRLVLLSDMHNPTGTKLPPALLREIIAAARDNGTWIVVDEVYLDFMATGECNATCFHYGDNVITTSSLTKVYGLGVLRFGWCFAPEAIAARMLELQDIVDPELPGVTQNLGTRALMNIDRLRARTHAMSTRGIPVIREWARQRGDVHLQEPARGVSVAIKVRGFEQDDGYRVCEYLRKKHGVAVAPGTAFEMPGWFRVNVAPEPQRLRAGLEALGAGLDAWRSRKSL